MVPEIGLRSVQGADFAREGKSTAKPEKQSAGGTRKNQVGKFRARVARGNKLCLLKKIYQ